MTSYPDARVEQMTLQYFEEREYRTTLAVHVLSGASVWETGCLRLPSKIDLPWAETEEASERGILSPFQTTYDVIKWSSVYRLTIQAQIQSDGLGQ